MIFSDNALSIQYAAILRQSESVIVLWLEEDKWDFVGPLGLAYIAREEPLMIVDGGVNALLSQQLTYLNGTLWGLFTNNIVILETTVLGDLVEASWAGYSRQSAGTWAAPVLATPRQVTVPSSNPGFSNTSGSAQTFYGWFVVDSTGTVLIAATNVGAVTLPDGGMISLAPSATDREE